MGYVVYGDIGSGSSIVEAALALAGADFDDANVDLGADAQRDDRYAEVNPQRKVPALVTWSPLLESSEIL